MVIAAIRRSTTVGPVRLASLTRCHRNDADGNPRWWLNLEGGGRIATASNASMSHVIPNPEFKNVDLMLTLDTAGRATKVAIVMSSEEKEEYRTLNRLSAAQMLPQSLVPRWQLLAARNDYAL